MDAYAIFLRTVIPCSVLRAPCSVLRAPCSVLLVPSSVFMAGWQVDWLLLGNFQATFEVL
jgi:hypothetical protein